MARESGLPGDAEPEAATKYVDGSRFVSPTAQGLHLRSLPPGAYDGRATSRLSGERCKAVRSDIL